MRTRIRLLTVLGVLLAVALVVGCAPTPEVEPTTAPPAAATEVPTAPPAVATEPPTAAPTRARLVIGLTEEPEVMDVQQATWSGLPHQQITEPLVMYDFEMKELLPAWLESWEISEDGTAITFHLPPGAKYSNGDVLDAQALADSMWRYANPEISMYPEDLEAMLETNVIDDSTLEVVFSEPQAALWLVLATEWGAPWDAAEAERIGNDEFSRMPVSNGPFELEEWVEGSHMLLVRNEYYETNLPFVENQGPPHLEEVLVRFIPEALTRVSELEAGTVDIIHDIPPSELARLRENANIEILEAPSPGMVYLAINHEREPFDDLRVREAIAMAINRADLVSANEGTVDPVYSLLAPAQICHSEDVEHYAMERYPYDVETAKALLAEAGWTDTDGDGIVDKDGQPLSVEMLVPPDDPPREKSGVVLQAQFQEIGIEVSIEELPYDFITGVLAEGEDYDLALDEMIWNDPDCITWMYDYPRYSNPEVEEKLDQGRYTPDLDERCAIYDEVQTTLIDDLWSVPLFASQRYLGVRTWVTGLIMHGPLDATFFLNDTTIQE